MRQAWLDYVDTINRERRLYGVGLEPLYLDDLLPEAITVNESMLGYQVGDVTDLTGEYKKMSECQTKAGHQNSHSLTLSFIHSRHAEQFLFSCLCSKVTLSLSHSLTLTHSHTQKKA